MVFLYILELYLLAWQLILCREGKSPRMHFCKWLGEVSTKMFPQLCEELWIFAASAKEQIPLPDLLTLRVLRWKIPPGQLGSSYSQPASDLALFLFRNSLDLSESLNWNFFTNFCFVDSEIERCTFAIIPSEWFSLEGNWKVDALWEEELNECGLDFIL